MRKIWIDALTPKQILFFSKLAGKLREKGFDVLLTTRDFREVKGLLEKKKLDAVIVGRYGGGKLEDKLRASIDRMRELLEIIGGWEPNLAISFTSPEASRIAFGLGIPHFSVSDSPHSIFVSKLAIPLSELLFTPWIIPKKEWVRYGINKEKIIYYKSLDPVAWLKDFTPSHGILNEVNLDLNAHRIVIRETETFASYLDLLDKSIAPVSDTILPVLLKELSQDVQFIIIPRYEEQAKYLKKKYSEKSVIVLDKVVDGASLLYYSTIFIGGGGTMNAEAALLGKPVISMYPGKTTWVEKYLIKKKLIIRLRNVQDIVRVILDLLNNETKLVGFSKRAIKILRKLENPVEKIADYIARVSNEHK